MAARYFVLLAISHRKKQHRGRTSFWILGLPRERVEFVLTWTNTRLGNGIDRTGLSHDHLNICVCFCLGNVHEEKWISFFLRVLEKFFFRSTRAMSASLTSLFKRVTRVHSQLVFVTKRK